MPTLQNLGPQRWTWRGATSLETTDCCLLTASWLRSSTFWLSIATGVCILLLLSETFKLHINTVPYPILFSFVFGIKHPTGMVTHYLALGLSRGIPLLG